MKFEEFLDIVDKNYYENIFELRYGQIIMNTLYSIWLEKYIEITTKDTDFDCYYDDRTTEFTLRKLENEWIDSLDNRV